MLLECKVNTEVKRTLERILRDASYFRIGNLELVKGKEVCTVRVDAEVVYTESVDKILGKSVTDFQCLKTEECGVAEPPCGIFSVPCIAIGLLDESLRIFGMGMGGRIAFDITMVEILLNHVHGRHEEGLGHALSLEEDVEVDVLPASVESETVDNLRSGGTVDSYSIVVRDDTVAVRILILEVTGTDIAVDGSGTVHFALALINLDGLVEQLAVNRIAFLSLPVGSALSLIDVFDLVFSKGEVGCHAPVPVTLGVAVGTYELDTVVVDLGKVLVRKSET